MISLSEVHASLSLFAESFTGQPVAITTVEDTRGCWPWTEAPAAQPVSLPAHMESRASYRIVLLHQLLRQVGAVSDLLASPAGQVLDLVESHRVMAEIRRDYPGATEDLRRVAQAAAAGVPAHEGPGGLAESAAAIMALLRWHSLSQGSAGQTDGKRATAVAVFDQVLRADATGRTSVQVASELMALLYGDDSLAFAALIDADPDEYGESVPTESSTGVSLDGGTPSEVVDSDGLAGGQLSNDLSEHDYASQQADESESLPPGIDLPKASGLRSLPARSRTYVYDEWDYHRRQHRPAWCRVIEEQLSGNDHDFLNGVRARYPQLRAQIRRSMLRLPAQQLVRVHRSLDGDELDLDAAIEAVTDRRAGAPVDDRLQIRRDRASRDVATAFLVDLSASTSSPAVPPEPEVFENTADPMDDPMSHGPVWDAPPVTDPVRRVIDVAKDAVALMADALHELGDLYAVYGFSGTGRDAVEFKVGKDFDDRTSTTSWASIGAMKPLRYTRMGPAVRHATAKLAMVAASTKLLIVVSDGYPQDVDYGHDRNDRDYGMHDTARALLDATNAGIEPFCVTIDPAGHDYLRVMCPDGRYLVIDDVESLPEELARLYLGTLGD